MATMNSDFSLQGGFGNLSAYKRKGSDKIIVRTKGGGSKHKIKTNAEFGGASQCSKKIKNVISQNPGDPNLSGRLTSLSRAILVLDTESPVGQRNILISAHRNLLEGFQLNQVLYLETVIRQPISGSVSRDQLNASVVLPNLIPGTNFYIPGKYPLFRFRVTLGIMPDMLYTPKGSVRYQPSHNHTEDNTQVILTDWAPTNMNYTGQNIVLQLEAGLLPDGTCSLILSLGIEFGMPLTNVLVNPIKYAGCAKILMVG
jgi:hypothetical protein